MLAEIIVSKGKDKPYQTERKYYIRVGSTNRMASQSELMRLFQAAGVFHYDGNGVEKSSIHDLNFTELDRFFGDYQIPQSGISFAHFCGSEIQSELIDKQNISGPLTFQVDRTLAIIKNNLQTPSTIQEGGNEKICISIPRIKFLEN